MKLYFLRHATAEDFRPGHGDALRRLTDEGLRESHDVGAGLQALGIRFDVIRTSPLVRARQTAEIVAEELGLGERLEEDQRLASGCDLGDLSDILKGLPGNARVLLVGHQPDLGELIRALTGGRVMMKKASLAHVELYGELPNQGELRWLLTAKQLRLIGSEKK